MNNKTAESTRTIDIFSENQMTSSNDVALAIVIPVYNTEKYVGEMLEDLKNMTFRDFTAFLVDDGSSDRSLDLITKFAKSDARFRVIAKNNGGPGSARNAALDAIQREKLEFKWVWFCDSDDRVDSDAVAKVIDAMERHDADYGLFSVCRFDRVGKYIYKANILKETVLDHEAIVRQYFRFGWKWRKEPCSEAFLNNKIFRFDYIKALKFYEHIRRAEDFDYFYRLLPALTVGVLIPDVFYHYRLRRSSLTNSHTQTGDLLVCSEHYGSLGARSIVEQKAMQHRLIRAYYLEACRAWGLDNQKKFRTIIKDWNDVKLSYSILFKDYKIIILMGILKCVFPAFLYFRSKISTRKIKDNFFD